MNTTKLETLLNETLDNYYKELSTLDEYDKTPATRGELAEYLKQTRYVLESFKNNIVEYLKDL